MEKWKQIQGYEGFYEISNFGNVRSIDRVTNNGKRLKGKIIKPSKTTNGYLMTRLCRDGRAIAYQIHRLVAIHFVENPYNKPIVNHNDGDKTNNRYDNLTWSTSSENTLHAIATGLKNEEKRIENVKKAKTKISPEQKQWIKDNYIARDKEFGAKAMAEKFDVTPVYISIIANSK